MTISVLDACCGSKMFWFDHSDARAIFIDYRRERHELVDSSSKDGYRILEVEPDVISNFMALPFDSNSFAMVVFDPPHLINNGNSGWQAKKYGKLPKEWREIIKQGFIECFRVLKPEGTLVFKWNEQDIPVSQILELTSERPLVGNRCGKASKSHWLIFMKAAD